MTLMHAWRWLRYPRVAWASRLQHRPCKGCGMRCVAHYPHEGRYVCINCWRVAGKELKGWKLWLFAIGALVAALAIWWPADVVQMPVQEYPAVVPHQRPPHPVSVYCPPGAC